MNARTRALYAKARSGLAEGDAGYWKAAEAMAQLAEAGETQRSIATELKCGQMTVQRYLKVWAESRGIQPRPPFAEAMAAVRGDRSDEKLIPKTPERRAALAADLLKDKAIYEEPAVRKVVDRHVNRELRQAAAAFNRDVGIPTRTGKDRDQRRLSPVLNRMFWRDLLWAIDKAATLLGEAVSEFERTGLPEGQSGEIIKAARNLSKKAERFGEAVGEHAVGSPMGREA